MDDGPDLSALAPVWVEALEREGLTSSVRVALWLDEQKGAPSAERVDIVLRRVRGEADVMDLAVEQGVPHSRIQTMLRRTGMRLVLPHLEEIAAWARARDGGLGDGAIADLAGTRPEVISLALDGWPNRDQPLSDTQVVEAYTQWVSGVPWPRWRRSSGAPLTGYEVTWPTEGARCLRVFSRGISSPVSGGMRPP